MKIDYPHRSQLPQLKQLWTESFGEGAYWELFFEQVFSSDRCRCITIGDQVAAALYWLDCRCFDLPMAYLYAVATDKKHRRQGLCRAPMTDTHTHLKSLGYAGCLLVPGENSLCSMYASMGYQTATTLREWECVPGQIPAAMHRVDAAEYARLRRRLLPEGSVLQEGDSLTLQDALYQFYDGGDFLLCWGKNDRGPLGIELLGNTEAAPGILAALRQPKGTFRAPGTGRPFAMYYPLSDAAVPSYFCFAFE